MTAYLVHLLILACIYLILAQSFNLNFGVGQLFNLAHVASFAIGAYVTALMSTDAGYSFFPCILASGLLSGFFSIFIGAISLRLAQDYFAIGTLAFSAVVSALLINWKSLTRGPLGIPGIPKPEIFGIDFTDNNRFLFLMIVAVIVVQLMLYFLFNSPYARSLRAQAEFEHAALSLAKNARLLKNISFFVASMCAGIAGSFFAYYFNYIDPSSFALSEMIFVLTIVVVGKPGSFFGCIAATIFLIFLPEVFRFVEMPPHVLGPLRQMLYAVVLFIIVFWKRSSLFPVVRTV